MEHNKRRVLTFIPASAAVVSNMVGTGVFTTTGFMIAAGAGSGDVLAAWLIGGVLALCGALCYGEIGAHMPESGGEYVFLTRLVHPSVGYLSGWVSIIVGFAAPIAASAMAMHLYLQTVWPWWPSRLMAAGTIIAIAGLHGFDVKAGSRFQTFFWVFKFLMIAAFIFAVLVGTNGDRGGSLTFNPGLVASGQFAGLLVLTSFAYSGWNAATYIGAEIVRPARTLPYALICGTLLVTTLYVCLNLAYVRAVPIRELSGVPEVANIVATTLWGPRAAAVVSGLIAVSLIAPISAMLMVGPRVSEAMARDGYLPSAFAVLNRHQVPSRAVWLLAGLAALIALTSTFSALLIYIGFTLNVFAAITVFGIFRLRRSANHQYRICVGYPVTPMLFIAFSIWTTVWAIRSEPTAALAGAISVAVGILSYVFRVTTFYNLHESRE
jgi:APA family basic amino acid/polyamine antiporter